MRSAGLHKRLFNFIIFSNLFIACCAVLMVWFTGAIFKAEVSPVLYGFIFFSTLASYSIHWYLTKSDEAKERRTNWLESNRMVHIIFFLLGSLGSSFFLILEIENLKWILPAVFLTLMYSAPKIPVPFFQALKKHIWGKTILLAAMWAYVTAALPLLVSQSLWNSSHWLFLFNRFALILAICILFDLRDREEDKEGGIKTIVTLLDHKRINKIFRAVIICCILSSFLFYFYLDDRYLVMALVVPAFLTYFLFNKAIKTESDYLFYFILDGLMALSPLLYLLKNL